jgi:hypothetical protein
MAEVNYLKQVVANGAAGLAVAQMTLNAHLLAELQRSINVF